MDSREALDVLRRHEAELRSLGVRRAALFGSTARGEADADSDLDVMVEVEPSARVGIYEYVGIVQYLESLFPVPVDVSNREAQSPQVRKSTEREAVYAF